MYKESMDAQTVVFVGDSFCKGYSLSYLNKNFNRINNSLQKVKEIYYKCNGSRNSWINYKQALLKESNRGLRPIERILNAIKTDKLSKTLEELPECEFVDTLGYKYIIGPRDGMDSASSVRLLHHVLPNNIEKRFEDDKEKGCKKLIVNFKTDVRDSIIIFNGLFIPYEMYKQSKTTIVYYESEEYEFPKNDDGEYRLDWCTVIPYSWEDISIKDRNIKPIKREKEWLVFDEEIGDDCLVFYQGVMYFFEVNKYNEYYIKLQDLDIGNINNFNVDDIVVFRLEDKNKLELKQQRLIGFLNVNEATAYFPATISNSIITYNGIEQQNFIIKPDKKSIKFKIPYEIYQINHILGLDDNSKVYAVNFYTGNLTNETYTAPQHELTIIANDLLKHYKDKLTVAEEKVTYLEKLNDILFDDYQEVLHFDSNNPTKFKLRFIPIESSIKFYINGVRYDKDLYWTYNSDNKYIEWTYTAFNQGFDIDSRMVITVTYDLYYDINGITDKDAFKDKQKQVIKESN
jgi:hypothetical protein